MSKKRDELIKKAIEEEKFQLRLLKTKSPKSLWLFNKYILSAEEGKNKVSLAPFHKELCNFVQDSADKKKLILIPRMHLKSTLVTVGYTLWRIVKDPDTRVLILSGKYDNAVDFVSAIQDHLTKNETLKKVFGDIAKNPIDWRDGRFTLSTNRETIGEKEPTVLGAGITSNVVSKHFDVVILDDIVVRENTETIEQVDKIIKRYKDVIDLMETNAQLIVIGTRWTDNDVYSWVLDPKNRQLDQFEVMKKAAMKWEGPIETALETGEGFEGSLWPQKFSRKELLKRFKAKGPYEFCTPAETPILMADWTEKPISEVEVGDEVIGYYRGTPEKRGKLVPTTVEAISETEDYVYDLEMESERKVRCTKTHEWYTGRHDKTHKLYRPAKIGSRLMFVCPTGDFEPTEEEKRLWMYLGGIFDGEGSAKAGGCLTITQGMGNEKVREKIRDVMEKLGITYSKYIREHDRDDWKNSVSYSLNDNFETQLKLIRIADIGKKDQLVDRLFEKSARYVRGEDKVVDMRKGKKEKVYGLQTGTGNYIAWGYASRNSTQYLNDPVPDTDATFRKEWFNYYEEPDLKGLLLNTYLTIDPAISVKKEADYTAMVVTSIDEYGNIYIRDIIRDRMIPSTIIDYIFRLAERWHPTKIGLEDVAWQKTLAYSMREEMNKRGRHLPVYPVKPHGRNKEERIKGLQPLYASGKVYHRSSLPDNRYLENELLRFPRAQNDDIIDALSYTLDFFVKPREKKASYNNRFLY